VKEAVKSPTVTTRKQASERARARPESAEALAQVRRRVGAALGLRGEVRDAAAPQLARRGASMLRDILLSREFVIF